jgi:hypothetical protein
MLSGFSRRLAANRERSSSGSTRWSGGLPSVAFVAFALAGACGQYLRAIVTRRLRGDFAQTEADVLAAEELLVERSAPSRGKAMTVVPATDQVFHRPDPPAERYRPVERAA